MNQQNPSDAHIHFLAQTGDTATKNITHVGICRPQTHNAKKDVRVTVNAMITSHFWDVMAHTNHGNAETKRP